MEKVIKVYASEVKQKIAEMEKLGFRYVRQEVEEIPAISSDEPIEIEYTLFFESV